MNFLIDTNIMIPMEPGSTVDLEINTPLALEFYRLANRSGNTIFIHPAIIHDIDRDTNQARASLRRQLICRYNSIESPPPPTILSSVEVGTPEENSNDWVDNNLLAALLANIVDYLVTEDIKLYRKATRLNLADRVLLLSEAIFVLRGLFDKTPPTPPAVEDVYVYQLNDTDPIFKSIHEDYTDFDAWLQKCKKEHRRAYIIRGTQTSSLAGICIIKEDHLPDGRIGKTLKVCTFKIGDLYAGNRYGELLLKAVFDYIRVNDYQYLFLTVYPKLERLIMFFNDFGFYLDDCDRSEYPGQCVLIKEMEPTVADISNLAPLDLHIKYGPFITSFTENSNFIVPIEPKYHEILFPEYERQMQLFPGRHPCGNSISKAYLSCSHVTFVSRGDNLFFYRSHDHRSITVIGIVEDTRRSNQPDEIAKFVGKRTVYTYADITEMCKKNVLAIKFRQVNILNSPINISRLLNEKILNGYPQSITRISNINWLREQIGL